MSPARWRKVMDNKTFDGEFDQEEFDFQQQGIHATWCCYEGSLGRNLIMIC